MCVTLSECCGVVWGIEGPLKGTAWAQGVTPDRAAARVSGTRLLANKWMRSLAGRMREL